MATLRRSHRPEGAALQRRGMSDAGTGWERSVLAALYDPVITIDLDGVIRSASESVERMFGWTPAELVGSNVCILMPEPHRSAHAGYVERFRRTGKPRVLNRAREFDAVHKDGSLFTVELCVTSADLAEPGGQVFVAIVHDVAERRRFEQELRLTQALAFDIAEGGDLLRSMHAALQHILGATGWDYGEVWLPESDRCKAGERVRRGACWPRRGRTLTALRRSGARGALTLDHAQAASGWGPLVDARLHPLSVVPEGSFARPHLARAAGLDVVATIPIRTRAGPTAVLVFYLQRRRPEDERLLALVAAAVHPLGQLILHKRTEEELAKHRHQLSRLITERTRQLEESHAKLRMADRMASLGTLAAGLGHDMDNILLPVRAHLNALERGVDTLLPPPRRRDLEGIRDCIAYLQQLSDGLQSLAADPDSDDAGADARTDLAAWWKQAGALLTKSLPPTVEFEVEIPEGLPPIGAAAHQLTQAVLNLLVNAGEAIARLDPALHRPGIVRFWAERAMLPDGAPAVRVAVADNGIGMSEESRRRAFEMFYTTKARGMGTGLGLPMVRRVAERAGGLAEVTSSPGEGATIVMLFPTAPGSERDEPEASRVIAVSLDEPRLGALVRQFLEVAGVTAKDEDEPADVDAWVLSPTPERRTRAFVWHGLYPRTRFLVVGAPGGDRSDWEQLGAQIIPDLHDIQGIREAILSIEPH